MNCYIKYITLFLFLLLSSGSTLLFAQPPGDDLQSGEVEIIKEFDARLEETEKVDVKPTLPTFQKQEFEQVYSIPSFPLQVLYEAPQIRPLAMKRDKVEEKYDGYLKLGYGTPNSPYAEAGYHLGDPKSAFKGGVFARHHSANNKSIENQRFMDNEAKVFGDYYFDQGFAVGADLGYTNNQVHLYGYDQADTTFLPEEVRRNVNTLSAAVRFFNGESTVGDLNYRAGFQFYRLNETFLASKETGASLEAGITKFFDEKHPLGVDLILDFTTFTDTAKQELHNYYLKPHFTFHAENFSARIGGILSSSNDDFRLFPDLEIAYALAGSQVGIFVGWKGDLYKNSFRRLLNYNPFISSNIDIVNTSYLDYFGGLKGKISIVEYRAQAGFKQAKDLPMFVNNANDPRQFDLLLDTVNIVYLKGSLGAAILKGLNIDGTVGYNMFDPRNEAKAWHLPELETNITVTFSPDEKLSVKGEVFIAAGVPFQRLDVQPNEDPSDRSGTLLDISLGAEYFFVKNIGGFVQINNLTSNKRERWHRYPSFGLNAYAGIVAKF